MVEAGLPAHLGSDQWNGKEKVEEACPLSLDPGPLLLVSLQLTFCWQECNHMATLTARESGKRSPAGLPLAEEEVRMYLGRQLKISPQRWRVFSLACTERRLLPCQQLPSLFDDLHARFSLWQTSVHQTSGYTSWVHQKVKKAVSAF